MHCTDLKTAGKARLDEVLALNRAVEEKTSPLDMASLTRLVQAAAFAGAMVDADGRAQAFLIGFAPGAAYSSPNYTWFSGRLTNFAYVDRVVVAEVARGRGLARALYDRFAAFAAEAGLGPLVCEVNLDPPNPGSDAFHASLGFGEMGRGEPQPGKIVRYLIRPDGPTGS